MKTEFLKNLGIEDQDVINQIMAENGRDVNKARSGNDSLTGRISELEEKNKELQNTYNQKLAEIQKDFAVKVAIQQAGGRNAASILPHLDMEAIDYEDGKLSGLDNQLKTLSESEETSFLFQQPDRIIPTGIRPGESVGDLRLNWNTPSNREMGSGVGLRDGIADAYSK